MPPIVAERNLSLPPVVSTPRRSTALSTTTPCAAMSDPFSG